jgi:outer membrane murein-binding lipoprotein Lpp
MMRLPCLRAALLAATALFGSGGVAFAQSAEGRLESIQQQIRALNAELARVKREMAAKDAAVRQAQQDASRARQTAEQTQLAVASLPIPAGFKQGNGAPNAPSLGLYAAHPDYPSPQTDWTSLNSSPVSASDQKAGATGHKGEFHIGGVTIQLGGFIDGDAVYRTRNEVTDIASNFNTGIPLRQSEQYHEGEFRESARQSRFAMLMHGDVSPQEHVAGYVELDLQGAAGTANSNESNSYNPRLRQAYLSYDNDSWGVHALAGQAWSLATMYKVGLTPRQEDLPLTIDQQYVPGFTWARQAELRIAKDFDQKYWLAASLESPQVTYSVASAGTGSNSGAANYDNAGISTLTPGQSYSTDIAPDLIVKGAADPGWGHYELYGMARFFQDRVAESNNGHSNTRLAGGVGGGFILPVLKTVSFEARGLAGYGIGRYGSAQLPDATIGRDGAPAPLPAVQALVGVVAHPISTVDLYGYVGTEQIGRKYFNVGTTPYGYGNPGFSNAGCDIELSTATCTANTSGIVQGTLGYWWRFLQGDFGTLQTGLQYSYTRRDIYKGTTGPGGTGNAGTDDNMVFFSLRYLPFQ